MVMTFRVIDREATPVGLVDEKIKTKGGALKSVFDRADNTLHSENVMVLN